MAMRDSVFREVGLAVVSGEVNRMIASADCRQQIDHFLESLLCAQGVLS
jgi:hypothetical protein